MNKRITLAAAVGAPPTKTQTPHPVRPSVSMPLIFLAALALTGSNSGAQTLYNFTNGTDGGYPYAALTVGPKGVLYGTADVAFQLTPPSSPGGAWAETPIYNAGTGVALALGSKGELYGTTYYGGAQDVGTVFELLPPSSPGGAWAETILYSFSVANGDPQNPGSGVVIGKNGVLYGTVPYAGLSPNCTYFGQLYGCGGVYSLTPPASPGGAWTEQTLYIFQGGSDGAVPFSTLAIGRNGELYGNTAYGGANSTCSAPNFYGATGCGIVFELEPPASPGGAWTETVLHSFTGGSDGGYPSSVVYSDGVLYGAIAFGGDLRNCGGVGCGGVFSLSPPASPSGLWAERLIYNFSGIPGGLFPGASLAIGSDGTLYGVTNAGGDAQACPEKPGCGVVFQLTPRGRPNGDWQERDLLSFNAADGFGPSAPLVIGSDGSLYGTTYEGGTSAMCVGGCGTVFKVAPKRW
jgi:uncharacterized repeat protein (TIGR03803 family)